MGVLWTTWTRQCAALLTVGWRSNAPACGHSPCPNSFVASNGYVRKFQNGLFPERRECFCSAVVYGLYRHKTPGGRWASAQSARCLAVSVALYPTLVSWICCSASSSSRCRSDRGRRESATVADLPLFSVPLIPPRSVKVYPRVGGGTSLGAALANGCRGRPDFLGRSIPAWAGEPPCGSLALAIVNRSPASRAAKAEPNSAPPLARLIRLLSPVNLSSRPDRQSACHHGIRLPRNNPRSSPHSKQNHAHFPHGLGKGAIRLFSSTIRSPPLTLSGNV